MKRELTQTGGQIATLAKYGNGAFRLQFLRLRLGGISKEVKEPPQKSIPNRGVGMQTDGLN